MRQIKPVNKTVRKIAIFRALQLGDMLCSIPSFRALRAYYPDTKITLIGLPWARDFAQRFPHYINEFFAFPGYPSLPERKFNLEAFPRFLQKVQDEQFDLVFQMHGLGTITNPLITLFHAKQSAGFYIKNTYCPNKKMFFIYPEELHETHKYLFLLKQLGIPSQGNYLEFPISKTEEYQTTILMQTYGIKKKKYIMLHPGGRDKKRQNGVTLFSTLANVLTHQGYTVVLTGTANEQTLCKQILKETTSKNIIDLSGKTQLGQLAYIIQHASLLVSNDTGASHLADALHTPSVILFTPYSNQNRWAPLNTQLHISLAPPYSLDQILNTATALLYHDMASRVSPRKEHYAN